jgi:hypothetical protein
MFPESLRKVPGKIIERIVNLKVPLTIRTGNHVHRKVMLAAICILTIVVFGAVIAAAGLSKAFVHASSVEGIGVGIYWDQACTNSTLRLDWGSIEAGSNTTLTVYIKNEGNSAASLWLGTSNWTPSAGLDYMSLNWNYSGQVLKVNQVIPVELTLTVYPTINGITDFSFKTIITISEG